MKFSTVKSLYFRHQSLTDVFSSPVPLDQTVDAKRQSKSPDKGIGRGPRSEFEVFNCSLAHLTPFLDSI